MMIDRRPGDKEDLITPSAPSAESSNAAKAEEEALPFEPFEYPFDN